LTDHDHARGLTLRLMIGIQYYVGGGRPWWVSSQALAATP